MDPSTRQRLTDEPQPIVTFVQPGRRGEPLYVADGLTVSVDVLADGTVRLEHEAHSDAGRQLLARRLGRTPTGRRKPRAM